MSKSNNIILLIIIILFGLSVWAIVPNSQLSNAMGRNEMRLGLDLKGGVHLVYQVDFADNLTATERRSAIDATLVKIQQRIDKFGVTEPTIEKLNDTQIMIELPGFTDIDAAKSLVEQTGFLEFREVERDGSGKLITLGDYLKQTTYQFIDSKETGSRLFVDTNSSTGSFGKLVAVLSKDATGITLTDANGNPADNTTLNSSQSFYSWVPSRGDDGTPLTGDLLADAQPGLTQATLGAQPEVDITWNAKGAVIFDQLASRLYNPTDTYSLEHVLGIFLDNALISAPQIRAQSFGGKGQISGSFTTASARELANLLKSGALPVKLTFLNGYDVSATLGAEFTSMVLKAGLIGMLLVMAFMIAYYRLPGLLASLALIFYGSLCLAVFKLWPVTLDLGGLGGFIASIGMAVDANVLIFERMREEFRTGRTLGAAIDAGFHRAWSAIRDSNLTTILACVILYWLGTTSAIASSAVKGFSLTLAIGVLLSMFTAITVTRTLLRLFINSSLANKTGLFTVSGGKK